MVQRAFQLYGAAIINEVLGMVKVALNGQVLFFVDVKAEPVIVLRNGEGFMKKVLVPAFMVTGMYLYQVVIITEAILLHMHGRMGIPLLVVPPTGVDRPNVYLFLVLYRLGLLCRCHLCE